MLGVRNELSVFVSAGLLGNMVCLSYYVLRVLRRLVRHTLFWISVEDLLFWVGTGLYIFVEMYRTCAGNIRWFFVLGVLLGGGITCLFMRKIDRKFICRPCHCNG